MSGITLQTKGLGNCRKISGKRGIADQVVKILAIKSAINVNKMALIGIIATSAIATSVKLAGKCRYPIKGSALPQAQYPTRRLTIARR